MTTPSPRTQAGRDWLANRARYEIWHPIDGRRDETLAAILAIEAEAAPAGGLRNGPCRFRKGRCTTHNWEGPSHERKQIWACPELWTAALAASPSAGESSRSVSAATGSVTPGDTTPLTSPSAAEPETYTTDGKPYNGPPLAICVDKVRP